MKSKNPIINKFPKEFQENIITLISKLIPVSAVKFWIYEPTRDITDGEFYNVDKNIEEVYKKKYSKMDPMYPGRYEGTDITIICSDTLMSDPEWRQSVFYKEFMAPRHYDHDADMLLRNDGKIIAVLYILREDRIGPFKEEELLLLRKLQPFIEYTLNNVYTPQRIIERNYLIEKFNLTERETDVVEIILTGVDIKTLAIELNLQASTVKTHLRHIFEKVGAHSTNELISILFRDLIH